MGMTFKYILLTVSALIVNNTKKKARNQSKRIDIRKVKGELFERNGHNLRKLLERSFLNNFQELF